MQTDLTFGQWALKWSLRTIAGGIVLAATIYLGDWAVWRLRGGALGKVTVSQFVVAPLKGNKEEYYPYGHGEVDCSVSLFPQAGAGACCSPHPVLFLQSLRTMGLKSGLRLHWVAVVADIPASDRVPGARFCQV